MASNRRITGFFKPTPDASSSSGPPDESSGWDLRLPPRIFATDRYPDARLNVYSRPDILTAVCKVLRGKPEFERILNSSLGSLFRLRISECPMSCKLIHALLCRQVLSKKKYELWTVFGGYPLCFSLLEFGAVTGLSCAEFSEDYDPDLDPSADSSDACFWDELIGTNRKTTLADISKTFKDRKTTDPLKKLRLALILIVDGYVEMLKDVDSFLSFPWDRESFLKTISTMRPDIKNKLQYKSFRLQGFPLALQLVAYRNIPYLLDKIPGSADPCTFLDWFPVGIPKNNLPLTDVLSIEHSTKPPEEGWGEWDDEVKDKKISFLISQIQDSHIFTKNDWPGGDCSLPLISLTTKKDDVIHMKHVVPMRKQGSAKLRFNQSPPKSKRDATRCSFTSNDKTFEDFKSSVERESSSPLGESEMMFKKLSAQNMSLTAQLRAFRYNRYRRYQPRRKTAKLSFATDLKLPKRSTTVPPEEVIARTPSSSKPPLSPEDNFESQHNWDQYVTPEGAVDPVTDQTSSPTKDGNK
ncbi:hypothetical protein CARUB_v10003519mg, partial [Capsella rubella]